MLVLKNFLPEIVHTAKNFMRFIIIADDVQNGVCTEYEVGNTNQDIAFYGWPHVFTCIGLAIANLYDYEGEEILSNVGRSCTYRYQTSLQELNEK